jgi:vacuolar-type H+-ATPase subunit I/STV1
MESHQNEHYKCNQNYMQKHKQQKVYNNQKGDAHVWVIGGVAVVALIVAWVAFDRSGDDLLPTVADEAAETQREIESSVETATERQGNSTAEVATEAEIEAAKAEARQDLLAIQTELETDATYDDVQQELNQVQADLEAAYANTSGELQAEYQVIRQELASLENSIRNETGDALNAIADLSLRLETSVRTDE